MPLSEKQQGPSTPQLGPVRSSFRCARDDSLINFNSLGRGWEGGTGYF
jgi:hypothetical protein